MHIYSLGNWNDHQDLWTKCLIELPGANVQWSNGQYGSAAYYTASDNVLNATLVQNGLELCEASHVLTYGQGCNDASACNYSESDTCNVSCIYAAQGMDCNLVVDKLCGEGTVWDEGTQKCIVANPSDSNFDGCVQLNDLLDLLSAYGDCGAEESAWQCGDALEYQGYDYETLQIGEQCWFAENLRAENYRNGEQIPANLSDAEWLSTTSGASAVYGNDDFILEANGRLYNCFAIKDSRAICPAGWGVPGISQFPDLENWPNETFSGYKNAFGNASIYLGINEVSYYWSRTESSEGFLLAADTFIDYTDFVVNDHDFNFGFSIRCLKDTE